jgi:hypothetical protein
MLANYHPPAFGVQPFAASCGELDPHLIKPRDQAQAVASRCLVTSRSNQRALSRNLEASVTLRSSATSLQLTPEDEEVKISANARLSLRGPPM